MPPPTPNPAAMLLQAGKALESGQLTLADILARDVLALQPQNARAHTLVASVAAALGRPDMAWDHFETAIACPSGSPEARKGLKALGKTRPAAPERPEPGSRGSLLIKAWGAGFWADVNHVLGQALLAEITGRTPVIDWGAGSLYRDDGVLSAWDTFFEPLSDATVETIAASESRYFPPKWNAGNLAAAEVHKWEGPGSRLGLELLNRPEPVVVSDFNLRTFSLMPWIPSWHRLHGADIEAVYRDLAGRCVRPRAEVAAQAQTFVDRHFGDGPVLGVHIRATDKVVEQPNLARVNAMYDGLIDRHIEKHPDARIFLLTDGAWVFKSLKEKHGDRLFGTESIRSDSQTGIHFQRHECRSRIGMEVLIDVLIALHCDAFIGYGQSSVSTFVMHLKDWPEGSLQLLGGEVNHHGSNPWVYVTRRTPVGR